MKMFLENLNAKNSINLLDKSVIDSTRVKTHKGVVAGVAKW